MFKKITYLITSLLVLLLIYFIYSYTSHTKDRTELATVRGKEVTFALKKDIESILQDVMDSGQTIAKTLEKDTLSNSEINSLLKTKSLELDAILGITVAFEPQLGKLYAPYYDKNQDDIIQLEQYYDYTDASLETTTWYVDIRDKGEQWVEPYFGQVVQELITDYGIPFYNSDGTLRGVVSMTISLKSFTDLIHSLSLGKTGYGFVSSSNGAILAHPVNDFVGSKGIEDLKEKEKNNKLKAAYNSILQGETGVITYKDNTKEQKTIFYYDTVKSSNWSIGVLFFAEDLLGSDTHAKRKLINIVITLSLVLFCLLGLYFNRDYLSEKEIWILSLFGSLILLANVFYIGYLEHVEKDIYSITQSPPIIDNTTLSAIINSENLKRRTNGLDQQIVIPTGVYLEELSFEDSYNINLSGNIWQKYPKDKLKEISEGFRFPQASPFAEAVYIQETYRVENDKDVLIGYEFRLTAKLNFIYSKYPFDKRNINLEIQPLNHGDNLLFVPDLDSYKVTNPSQKSGISPNISLSGNKILESYFSYNYFTYDNNFGFEDASTFNNVPELHFNVNIKRVLINAFVTYLIPIFVTLIMMFIMIYASNKRNSEDADTSIVQGMTAFFFVLVFSHIDLRKNIETAELIYMEYFYFITYFMIILSTYNLIMYTKPKASWFDYKNNLIIKSLFWPTFLILVLLVSLFLFY
ncbi:PDC sensor domain-containing protein [Lacinutrix salivirga]